MTTKQKGEPKRVAVVLAGAAAKGAFEAGAMEVLLGSGIAVRRIVATSSGALNGTAIAAGLRAGRGADAAKDLVRLWGTPAETRSAITPSLRTVLGGEGLSDQRGLLRLLREHVRTCTAPQRDSIELKIVVAALRGRPGQIDGREATTFEQVLTFSDDDFDTANGLKRVFDATVASCTFPGVFAPSPVPRNGSPPPREGVVGPCLDGGAVNNVPIKHALLGDDVDTVIVVAPLPVVRESEPNSLRWMGLVSQVGEMLINERLYRDVRDAEQVNAALRQLASLGLSKEQHDAVVRAFVRDGAREIQIVQVRPEKSLPGGAFDAICDSSLVTQYVEAGRAAARACLATASLNSSTGHAS